jgi:hypothetical protein
VLSELIPCTSLVFLLDQEGGYLIEHTCAHLEGVVHAALDWIGSDRIEFDYANHARENISDLQIFKGMKI